MVLAIYGCTKPKENTQDPTYSWRCTTTLITTTVIPDYGFPSVSQIKVSNIGLTEYFKINYYSDTLNYITRVYYDSTQIAIKNYENYNTFEYDEKFIVGETLTLVDITTQWGGEPLITYEVADIYKNLPN